MPLPRVRDVEQVRELGQDRFDLHYHTRWSDGLATVRAAMTRAHDLGIRLAITDHNIVEGALQAWTLAGDEAPDLLIPGIEITTAERIHLLIYFRNARDLHRYFVKSVAPWRPRGGTATTPIQRGVFDLLEDLDRYDALTAAAHPFAFAKNGWLNVRERFAHIAPRIAELDAVEVLNGQELDGTNDKAATWARKRHVGLTAGSDGHTLGEMGNVTLALPPRADLFAALREGAGTLVDLRPPGNWRQVVRQGAKAPYYLKKPGRFLWRSTTGDAGDGPETAGFTIDSWPDAG